MFVFGSVVGDIRFNREMCLWSASSTDFGLLTVRCTQSYCLRYDNSMIHNSHIISNVSCRPGQTVQSQFRYAICIFLWNDQTMYVYSFRFFFEKAVCIFERAAAVAAVMGTSILRMFGDDITKRKEKKCIFDQADWCRRHCCLCYYFVVVFMHNMKTCALRWSDSWNFSF